MCVLTHIHLTIHEHAHTYTHAKLQFIYERPKSMKAIHLEQCLKGLVGSDSIGLFNSGCT